MLLFGVGVLLLGLALLTADLAIVFLPLTAFAAMMAYLDVRDPRAGLEADTHAVSVWRGRTRETVPLSEIDRVHVEQRSDSVDVTIYRQGGSVTDIPPRCRPGLGSLTQALRRAGITVTKS